ncbi:hypothetical protein [Amycolatopsis sp. GM8]|uniref:hypothetical protein n=1 Tax=Amycolatopsis sp. GM8 TaxID=2896530 RepID=UPI001F23BF37|nr:hypothetical protein [Amycolatopsis sp. GM8]
MSSLNFCAAVPSLLSSVSAPQPAVARCWLTRARICWAIVDGGGLLLLLVVDGGGFGVEVLLEGGEGGALGVVLLGPGEAEGVVVLGTVLLLGAGW